MPDSEEYLRGLLDGYDDLHAWLNGKAVSRRLQVTDTFQWRLTPMGRHRNRGGKR